MKHSTITIDVITDSNSHPNSIEWQATDSGIDNAQQAKAMMLAFWDGDKKSALHIDLWTKEMMVDEMADFYYQMLVTMADTFSRATAHSEFVEQMKTSANDFYLKFGELRKKEMRARK
ncbi:MAG TPA: gliding motility protein GldC [Gallionella sp.]|nr:gliding motility protein GldC [Gallionella sp.]